uniref:C2H2-type domain-containing protein n=1 Tax=Leersia perrieri TaxID=77586 RepID=A0A0D9WPM3_9ORYZ
MEQATVGAGAGELATGIMSGAEGSRLVLHDEREAQRKGKRKMKELRGAKSYEDGASRKEKRRPYMCKHCNEEFSTHQALGGHMAGHHKEKRILKEKLLGRSLVLEEQPERSLNLKEKQPERGLILGEKQPERIKVLKEKQPERSLTLEEKQPEVYQDKIDQIMNSQETTSNEGAAYLDGGSNTEPNAEPEEDRRLPYDFDLNLEASEQE